MRRFSYLIALLLNIFPLPAIAQEFDKSALLAMEQALYLRVNEYRTAHHLPQLTWDLRISAVARQHSKSMAEGRAPFGHERFSQRLKLIALPYRAASENVAANSGYEQPDIQAMADWLSSPSHRQNLEGRYSRTGVGIACTADEECFFTQIFIQENALQTRRSALVSNKTSL
ncbi:MAG: CAP domain-containing protein [Anaerolineae bacterium]|nr:CAP domain-containing protein [Gloeobacterales cyanobacterium ES-bin-313]